MRSHLIALATAISVAMLYSGCAERQDGDLSARDAARQFPPPPQTPRVAALGNLRFGHAPSNTQVKLSLFFFGVEPERPAGLIRPIDVAADGGDLFICDTGLEAVFYGNANRGGIGPAHFDKMPQAPTAVEITPGGDRLITDTKGAAVLRYDRSGQLIRPYAMDEAKFRPAAALEVDAQVWVSNIALHTIEVFDRDSGEHLRTIGGRGSGPGRFGIPLGMARTPDGDVCIADMLNNRVQVLDASGKWIRDIGSAGNRVGEFGRPKDVAVGPDGTVFVADVASQRVHVFSPDGTALLAFGEPTWAASTPTAPGSTPISLELPGGICIVNELVGAADPLPAGFDAAYYVLVVEQTRNPGVRVYAWGKGSIAADGPITASAADELLRPARRATPGPVNQRGTANPHWSPKACATCHGDQRQAIPAGQADGICLKCHDGKRALAELHPVGRSTRSAKVSVPSGWPLNGERLSCLTCHEIRRHCDVSAKRPLDNSAMLRAFDGANPHAFCGQCHTTDVKAQINPHQQLDPDGAVIEQSCLYCHNAAPPIPADGARLGKPDLRIASSRLCLSCHTRHWDVSTRGHVERPLPDRFHRLAKLPLSAGNVACFTCHNPHQPGLFAAGSVLAAWATVPIDSAVRLRMNSMELCIACHTK